MNNDIIKNPKFNIIEESEVWVEKKPAMGDHIRVNRGLYCHHGIYVSDDEVIHFTGKDGDNVLDWSKPEVITSDLDYFLKGDKLEVKEYTEDELEDLYPADHIVKYARACLGDKGYNLIFNNCEHFANTCTLGRFISKQVENVFGNLLKVPTKYGGSKMGFFDKMGDAIKDILGAKKSSSVGSNNRSVSNSNYNYEPDKAKVAEIEANAQIRLEEMDKERVELIKNSQLELLRFNTNCQITIEEAKIRNLNSMAQSIVNLQTRLNEVAFKRLEIIEKGSMPIIKEIEVFYNKLGEKIKQDNEEYTTKKLPSLLEILDQYEKGTTAHDLYYKAVKRDMEQQMEHYSLQTKAILERQNNIIDSFTKNKENIINQTQEITKSLLESVQIQIEQNGKLLESNTNDEHILKIENKDNTKLLK